MKKIFSLSVIITIMSALAIWTVHIIPVQAAPTKVMVQNKNKEIIAAQRRAYQKYNAAIKVAQKAFFGAKVAAKEQLQRDLAAVKYLLPPPRNESLTCTTEARTGLDITLLDQNNNPVVGAVITTNPASDPFIYTNGHYVGLWEKQGEVSFTITKTGFKSYTNTVTLMHDACHVITQTKIISLTTN